MLACATHTARTRNDGGAPDPDIRLSEGAPENGGILSEALRRRELPQFIDCRRTVRCSVHSRFATRALKCCEAHDTDFCQVFRQEFVGEKTRSRSFHAKPEDKETAVTLLGLIFVGKKSEIC